VLETHGSFCIKTEWVIFHAFSLGLAGNMIFLLPKVLAALGFSIINMDFHTFRIHNFQFVL
jgi:hypothetical protein